MSRALIRSHPQAHTSATPGRARPQQSCLPCLKCPSGDSRAPSQAHLLPGPEGNHWLPSPPLAQDRACSGLPGAAPGLSCRPQTSGAPGDLPGVSSRGPRASRGPEEQRLSPPPRGPREPASARKEVEQRGGPRYRSPGSRAEARSTSPNTHPSFFQGAWPQHPTDEPGAAPGSRQPPEPLWPSRPLPGIP